MMMMATMIITIMMMRMIAMTIILMLMMQCREPVAFFCYFSSFELMTRDKKESTFCLITTLN